MRSARLRMAAFVVLAALVAACANPLRDFGKEEVTPPPPPVAFDSITADRLRHAGPMPRVRKQAVSGAVAVDPIAVKLSTAWRAYLDQLNDGRLATHPTPMRAVEAKPGESFGKLCDLGPNHRYPELLYPTYCPDFDQGDAAPALVVLPAGFTAKVRAFAREHSSREAWILAAIVTGEAFSTHLRQEMALVGMTWPDGRPFNYCTVGIGLRTLFPANVKELKETDLAVILAALDTLSSPPDDPDARLRKLATGFATGRLDMCLG